jgi:hypothetical protein
MHGHVVKALELGERNVETLDLWQVVCVPDGLIKATEGTDGIGGVENEDVP